MTACSASSVPVPLLQGVVVAVGVAVVAVVVVVVVVAVCTGSRRRCSGSGTSSSSDNGGGGGGGGGGKLSSSSRSNCINSSNGSSGGSSSRTPSTRSTSNVSIEPAEAQGLDHLPELRKQVDIQKALDVSRAWDLRLLRLPLNFGRDGQHLCIVSLRLLRLTRFAWLLDVFCAFNIVSSRSTAGMPICSRHFTTCKIQSVLEGSGYGIAQEAICQHQNIEKLSQIPSEFGTEIISQTAHQGSKKLFQPQTCV